MSINLFKIDFTMSQ